MQPRPASFKQELDPGTPIVRRLLALLVWLTLPAAIPIQAQDSVATDSAVAIVINVPAFRLDVVADTHLIRSFPVAVGMRRYPTPVGDFAITEVQWNPSWHPPDSPWAEKDSITPPGPGNPMGKVKLALGGSLLFLHGTPLPASIGKPASHACIRLRNNDAIALAQLVQAARGAVLPESTIDSLIKQWQPSRRVVLPVAMPVRIVYNLVERRGDELLFHPDVYRRGRDEVLATALVLIHAAGYDTARVDRDRLERAANAGVRSRTSVAIARLLPP